MLRPLSHVNTDRYLPQGDAKRMKNACRGILLLPAFPLRFLSFERATEAELLRWAPTTILRRKWSARPRMREPCRYRAS